MAITDQQVAALRALLMDDRDEYQRLWAKLHEQGEKEGFFHLLLAAFDDAVRERFHRKKRSDIIEWVADVRARMDPGARIDPSVAERLILWAFGQASTDGIDFDEKFEHQMMLLFVMVEERGLSKEELDAFLQKARSLMDEDENSAG